MSPIDEKLDVDKFLIEHIGMLGIANDKCRCFDCMQKPFDGENQERKFLDSIMQERQVMIQIIRDNQSRKLIVTNKAQQQIDERNQENLSQKLNAIAISILTLLYLDKSLSLDLILVNISKRVVLLRQVQLDEYSTLRRETN